MATILDDIKAVERSSGLCLSQAQRLDTVRYLTLLERWGRKINLTADPSPRRIVGRHLPDALYLYRKMVNDLNISSSTRYADIGSGAGLPGLLIPILVPELDTTLVESVNKKCTFLRTVVHELGLEHVNVINQRVKDAGLSEVDIVSSRATWAPDTWLNVASSVLKAGGAAVVFSAHEIMSSLKSEDFKAMWQSRYKLDDGTQRVQTFFRRL